MATMAMMQIQCRDHYGTFQIPSRRGRPPVRCTPENRCSKFSPDTPPVSVPVPVSVSAPISTTIPSLEEPPKRSSPKPKRNDNSHQQLPFNPKTITDQDLVSVLSGRQIEWWNMLGNFKEEAVVSPLKIRIDHTYYGVDAKENLEERAITFVDHVTKNYHTVRLDTLRKIG